MRFHCVVHRILSTALQGGRLGLLSSFHSKPREVNSVAPSCTAGRCFQPLKTKYFFYDDILLLSDKSEGNLKNPWSSNFNSLHHLSLLLLTDLNAHPLGHLAAHPFFLLVFLPLSSYWAHLVQPAACCGTEFLHRVPLAFGTILHFTGLSSRTATKLQ